MGHDIAEPTADRISILIFFAGITKFNGLYLHQYLSNGDGRRLEFILLLSSIEWFNKR